MAATPESVPLPPTCFRGCGRSSAWASGVLRLCHTFDDDGLGAKLAEYPQVSVFGGGLYQVALVDLHEFVGRARQFDVHVPVKVLDGLCERIFESRLSPQLHSIQGHVRVERRAGRRPATTPAGCGRTTTGRASRPSAEWSASGTWRRRGECPLPLLPAQRRACRPAVGQVTRSPPRPASTPA